MNLFFIKLHFDAEYGIHLTRPSEIWESFLFLSVPYFSACDPFQLCRLTMRNFYLLTIDTIINNNRKDFIIEGWIAHGSNTFSFFFECPIDANLLLFFLSLSVLCVLQFQRYMRGHPRVIVESFQCKNVPLKFPIILMSLFAIEWPSLHTHLPYLMRSKWKLQVVCAVLCTFCCVWMALEKLPDAIKIKTLLHFFCWCPLKCLCVSRVDV